MRPTHRIAVMALVAAVLAGCGGGGGGGGGNPDIEVVGAPQAAEPVAGSSQVALTLANTGDGDDTLVGASTTSAAGTELHRSEVSGGRATMEVVDRIDVPAGQRLAFRPGETHLMLVVPDETVRLGGTLELVLDFERSPDVTVEVAVVELTELFEGSFDGTTAEAAPGR